MTFDMRDAREIAEKCNSKDESIDHDYWNAHAGMFLPTALDEIERLQTALVEERACLIEAGGEPVGKRLLEEDQKDLDGLAREQLHQEGKL